MYKVTKINRLKAASDFASVNSIKALGPQVTVNAYVPFWILHVVITQRLFIVDTFEVDFGEVSMPRKRRRNTLDVILSR